MFSNNNKQNKVVFNKEINQILFTILATNRCILQFLAKGGDLCNECILFSNKCPNVASHRSEIVELNKENN